MFLHEQTIRGGEHQKWLSKSLKPLLEVFVFTFNSTIHKSSPNISKNTRNSLPNKEEKLKQAGAELSQVHPQLWSDEKY